MIFRLQKKTKVKVAKKKENYTQRLGSNVSGMMTISSHRQDFLTARWDYAVLFRTFFFSFSDTRQVTLFSDLEGKKLRRNIWHLHETCVRYFSNFRYTEITIHILVNMSCLEVIVLISNRCVSTEAFRRKGECKKKFFVCSFLLNNRRLSVRTLGNLWYNNNFTHSSAHMISLIAPWFFYGTNTVIVKWDYMIHIYTILHGVFCIQKIPFFYLFSDFNRWHSLLF